MQDFQHRVVDEKRDLDTKLGKLHVFIDGAAFQSLPAAQRNLLTAQSAAMTVYSAVLGARIAAFEPTPEVTP